jgi:hypothetical protein
VWPSLRESYNKVKVKFILKLTVSLPDYLCVRCPPGTRDQCFPFKLSLGSSGFVDMWHLLMRGWVCSLRFAQVLASAGFLGSKFCRTCDQILLSPIWDSPSLEDLVDCWLATKGRILAKTFLFLSFSMVCTLRLWAVLFMLCLGVVRISQLDQQLLWPSWLTSR